MILDHYKPDIIGVQEVSPYQMSSLEKSSHCVSYKFLGKFPTKQPIESGLGIFYNSQKLLLISDLSTVWLNESQIQAEGCLYMGWLFL